MDTNRSLVVVLVSYWFNGKQHLLGSGTVKSCTACALKDGTASDGEKINGLHLNSAFLPNWFKALLRCFSFTHSLTHIRLCHAVDLSNSTTHWTWGSVVSHSHPKCFYLFLEQHAFNAVGSAHHFSVWLELADHTTEFLSDSSFQHYLHLLSLKLCPSGCFLQ